MAAAAHHRRGAGPAPDRPTPTSWSAWPGRCGPPSRPGSWMPGAQPARPGSTWPTGPGSTPTRSASSIPARPSSSRPAGPSSSVGPAGARAGAGAGGGQRPAGRRHERGRAGLCRRGHRRGATPGGALATTPARPRPARPGAAAGPGRTQRRRPGHRAGGCRPCQPPRAPASCSPSAERSPTATRPPSPPSSRPAGARNPTGTPPTSCSGFGPLAGGDAGGDGPASPAGLPGSPTWGGCAMTEGRPRVGGRGPHLPVLTVSSACLCPPSVGHPTPPQAHAQTTRPPKPPPAAIDPSPTSLGQPALDPTRGPRPERRSNTGRQRQGGAMPETSHQLILRR